MCQRVTIRETHDHTGSHRCRSNIAIKIVLRPYDSRSHGHIFEVFESSTVASHLKEATGDSNIMFVLNQINSLRESDFTILGQSQIQTDKCVVFTYKRVGHL